MENCCCVSKIKDNVVFFLISWHHFPRIILDFVWFSLFIEKKNWSCMILLEIIYQILKIFIFSFFKEWSSFSN